MYYCKLLNTLFHAMVITPWGGQGTTLIQYATDKETQSLKSQEPIVLSLGSYEVNVCVPKTSFVEAQSPNVTVFGNGNF